MVVMGFVAQTSWCVMETVKVGAQIPQCFTKLCKCSQKTGYHPQLANLPAETVTKQVVAKHSTVLPALSEKSSCEFRCGQPASHLFDSLRNPVVNIDGF